MEKAIKAQTGLSPAPVFNPEAIFNVQFFNRDSKGDQKAKWKKVYHSGLFFDYLSRLSACFKLKMVDPNFQFQKYPEMFQFQQALFSCGVEKYSEIATLTSGIYVDGKGLSDLELKQFRKNFKKTIREDQNIWSAILSFKPEWFETGEILDVEVMQKIVYKNFQTLLKQNQMHPGYLNLVSAFHVNTTNPHFHLVFYENYPSKLTYKGEEVYQKRGNLREHSLKEFKFNTFKDMTLRKNRVYEGIITKRDNILDYIGDHAPEIISKMQDPVFAMETDFAHLLELVTLYPNLKDRQIACAKGFCEKLLASEAVLEQEFGELKTLLQATDTVLNEAAEAFLLADYQVWFEEHILEKKSGVKERIARKLIAIIEAYLRSKPHLRPKKRQPQTRSDFEDELAWKKAGKKWLDILIVNTNQLNYLAKMKTQIFENKILGRDLKNLVQQKEKNQGR